MHIYKCIIAVNLWHKISLAELHTEFIEVMWQQCYLLKFKACLVFYCKQAPIISNIYILNAVFICILSMLSMHLPHKGAFVFL